MGPTYLFCCNRANRFTLVEVSDECGNKSTARRERDGRGRGRVEEREEDITLLCKLMTEIDEIFSSR